MGRKRLRINIPYSQSRERVPGEGDSTPRPPCLERDREPSVRTNTLLFFGGVTGGRVSDALRGIEKKSNGGTSWKGKAEHAKANKRFWGGNKNF